MAYAVVQDVPASWAEYEAMAGIAEPLPDGLILHVAGPTDEGFRTIEIWESRDACERFHADGHLERRAGSWAAPTRRELVTRTTVFGPPRPTARGGARCTDGLAS
jgi:hypothetical protein